MRYISSNNIDRWGSLMAFEIEFYKTKDGKQGSNITRVLYFFYIGKKIIATNGFVKKTQKTPPKELKLAKERRADWLERHKEVRDDT